MGDRRTQPRGPSRTGREGRKPGVRAPSGSGPQPKHLRRPRDHNPRELPVKRSTAQLFQVPKRGMLRQEEPDDFAASALPLTMELASVFRPLLIERLRNTPASWPFHDRVLVWMDGDFRKDVKAYRSGEGNALAAMLNSSQLERVDLHLLQILINRLDRIRPGIAKLLQGAVEGTD